MGTAAQSRVPQLIYRLVLLQHWDVHAERCSPMAFSREAQPRRHRRTGPDGESWTDVASGIVRRCARRSLRPAAVADIPAVVRGGGRAGPCGADLPRSPHPDVTVDVHRRYWLRLCARWTRLAGDSARGRPARADTGRLDVGQRLG